MLSHQHATTGAPHLTRAARQVAWLARYYGLRPLEVGGRLAKVAAIGAKVTITWLIEERLPEDAPKRRGAVGILPHPAALTL